MRRQVRLALGANRNASPREDAPDASGAGSAPTRKSGGDLLACRDAPDLAIQAAHRPTPGLPRGRPLVPGVPRRLPTRPRRRCGDGSLRPPPRSSGSAAGLAPAAGTLLERRALQREATRTATGPRERRRTRPQATACRLPDRPPPTPDHLDSSREPQQPPTGTDPAAPPKRRSRPGNFRSPIGPRGQPNIGAFACLGGSLLAPSVACNRQRSARVIFLCANPAFFHKSSTVPSTVGCMTGLRARDIPAIDLAGAGV